MPRIPPLVACHCDPLCENFLDTGERMWIVDWEYSGMNDPMWDLGDLSVEGQVRRAPGEEMMRAYFGGEPTTRRARPHRHLQGDVRPPVDAVGPYPACQQNPAEDFLAYADGRFARCRKLMQSADFSRHVEAVRKG